MGVMFGMITVIETKEIVESSVMAGDCLRVFIVALERA